MNNVKIITSFNFHVIPGIISRDEHISTFGSGILGNIIVLRDNVNGKWRCKYINLFTWSKLTQLFLRISQSKMFDTCFHD